MNYPEFIDEVHAFVEDDTITKAQTKDVVEAFVEALRDTLIEKNDDISIPHLGSFKFNVRDARKARNPRTGETVDVPKKAAVKFKLAASFKKDLAEVEVE